jgi:ribosomal protein S18 acetylase RimI-like enzyme
VDLRIIRGNQTHFEGCLDACKYSELWDAEFSTGEYNMPKILSAALDEDEVYVSLGEKDVVSGFIWYRPRGVFNYFGYIHLVAINKDYRGKGVGSQLFDFIEKRAAQQTKKIFLVVGEFNSAIKMYEKRGYKRLCGIPDLFIQGVTETLMAKPLG